MVYALSNNRATIVKVDWRGQQLGVVRRYRFEEMVDLHCTKDSVVFSYEVKHVPKRNGRHDPKRIPVGFIEIRDSRAVYDLLLELWAERKALASIVEEYLDEIALDAAGAAAGCMITQAAEEEEDEETPWDFTDIVVSAQELGNERWIELTFLQPNYLKQLQAEIKAAERAQRMADQMALVDGGKSAASSRSGSSGGILSRRASRASSRL